MSARPSARAVRSTAAVNQDKLGVQGVPIASELEDVRTASCWHKPLADGSTAVILLNTGDTASTISCGLADLGVAGKASTMRDLWTHTDAPFSGTRVSAKLESHEHKFYILKK
eukprot:SAG22_NODE_528_length_9431_cov_7.192135_7_plen_113_part_00